MSVEQKLAELGLTLPNVATPAGAYVPAVISGNLVFTAGQIPLVDGTLMATGKVGQEISPEFAKEIAQRCALNALAAVKSVIGDLSRVKRVVKDKWQVALLSFYTNRAAKDFLNQGERQPRA